MSFVSRCTGLGVRARKRTEPLAVVNTKTAMECADYADCSWTGVLEGRRLQKRETAAVLELRSLLMGLLTADATPGASRGDV